MSGLGQEIVLKILACRNLAEHLERKVFSKEMKPQKKGEFGCKLIVCMIEFAIQAVVV
jgi:hypothetical protein